MDARCWRCKSGEHDKCLIQCCAMPGEKPHIVCPCHCRVKATVPSYPPCPKNKGAPHVLDDDPADFGYCLVCGEWLDPAPETRCATCEGGRSLLWHDIDKTHQFVPTPSESSDGPASCCPFHACDCGCHEGGHPAFACEHGQFAETCPLCKRPAMPKYHDLKTWPPFFEALVRGDKTCEVRRFDRDFVVGDHLLLREWEPGKKTYTGREARFVVTHILPPGAFGLPQDVGVLSVKPVLRAALAKKEVP